MQARGIEGVVAQGKTVQAVQLLRLEVMVDVDLEWPLEGLLGHAVGRVPLVSNTDVLDEPAVEFQVPLDPGELQPEPFVLVNVGWLGILLLAFFRRLVLLGFREAEHAPLGRHGRVFLGAELEMDGPELVGSEEVAAFEVHSRLAFRFRRGLT